MVRHVTARAVHFRRGLNFFTLSNKPFTHSFKVIPFFSALQRKKHHAAFSQRHVGSRTAHEPTLVLALCRFRMLVRVGPAHRGTNKYLERKGVGGVPVSKKRHRSLVF